MLNKFSERLKSARNECGISQKKLAEKLFVSQQTIAKWETDKATPNPETITKIADLLNISLDYLLGRVDNNVSITSISEPFIKIPVLGNIPAGVPIEAIEDILGHIDIPESMATGGKEFFALKIKGDSMSPKYENGDVVLFEHCSSCDSGSDCAVMVNGDDVTFKRVEIVESGIMLKPMNSNYETMFYTKKDIEDKPVRIIGIARQVRRDV